MANAIKTQNTIFDLNMTDNEDNSLDSKKKYHWLDIFLNVITSPIRTFSYISNCEIHTAQLSNILGAAAVVIIAGLADSCVNISSVSADELCSDILSSLIVDLFFWLILAIFARFLAFAMKIKISIRSSFMVIGWSFVPLLLKAPAACLSNVSILGDLLSIGVSIWFLTLVLISFDSLLKLGKLKTLVYVLLLPPCLFFSYLIALIFANKFIINGLF